MRRESGTANIGALDFDLKRFSRLEHSIYCQESLVWSKKIRLTWSKLITHFRESSIVRRESGTATIGALDFDFERFSRLEPSINCQESLVWSKNIRLTWSILTTPYSPLTNCQESLVRSKNFRLTIFRTYDSRLTIHEKLSLVRSKKIRLTWSKLITPYSPLTNCQESLVRSKNFRLTIFRTHDSRLTIHEKLSLVRSKKIRLTRSILTTHQFITSP